MEGLVYKFHNLPGDSVPEHKKQFNFYLHHLENENIDILELLPLLHPENRQEELFYLKLLFRFECNNELFTTLLKGDRILNRILVNNPRFIRLFNNVPADTFVENICPNISYVTRTNIIYKLSFVIEDVNVGESYYANVKNKYGFKIASPLLVACREKTLMQALTEYEIKLKDRQLIAIYKKYPEFCKFYFKKQNIFYHYDIFGEYLCINNVHTFHELLVFGQPNIGKRAFLKYLKSYKEDVIKNPLTCNYSLRFKLLQKHLTYEEFTECFKNLFPKNPESSYVVFNENVMKCLKLFPVDARGKLLSNIFDELYGIDYFNITMLEMLSLEDRLKFKLDDNHIEMFGVDKSIPEIKNKINLTQDQNGRRELVEKLVKTCKINNDLGALLGVLEYFCKRHKNDIQFIRTSFIQSLNDNFTLEKLSTEYWKYIDELMLLFEINDEYWYGKVEIYKKSIQHKVKNNLDYTATIKYLYKAQGTYNLPNLQDYPEHEKAIILSFPNVINAILEEEDRKYAEKHFLEWIGSYNIRNSKDSICIFNYPNMIRGMLKDLKDNKYPYFDNGFSKYILRCQANNDEEQALIDEIIEGFVENPSFFYAPQFGLKLIHTKPNIFLKHTAKLLEAELRHESLYYELSKMYYTELYKKVCEDAINFLNDKKCNRICAAISFLSFVKPEEFEEIIQKYLPKAECKIDVHADEMQETLQVQQCILKCFKNFSLPGDRIETILHFCNRDYLQYALDPLYFTLYHAPEKAFVAPVMQLLDRAVSVRKHTIYLTTTLGSTTYIYNLLKQLGTTEKNASLRKFIFKRTFKKLVDDQSEDFWELTKEHFKLLDVQDTESLNLILTVSNIPTKFIPSYVKVLWDYLKQRGEDMEFNVLPFINKEILGLLSDEFCDEIIKHSLFNEKNSNSTDVFNLVTKYLILSGDKLDHRLEIIWNCINRLHESVDFLDKAKRSKQVYEFLEVTCSFLLAEKKEHTEKLKEIIKKMSDKLDELQIPCNKYENQLIFELTDFFFTLENDQMKCVAEIIVKQQTDATKKLGVQAANFYGSFISGYLLTLFTYIEGERTEQYLSLVENLLEINDSQEVRLLCLGLLPRKISMKPTVKKRQRDILEKIGTDATPLVEVQFFKLLRHLDL